MALEKTYRNQIDFLEKEGYLNDASTAEDLAEGKKAWRRYYKKQHRKESKKRRPEITVIFPDCEMYGSIKAQAERHKSSMSRFMWECVSMYLKQNYLQLQPQRWDIVSQNIELTRLSMQQIQAEFEDGSQAINNALLLEKLMELQENLEQVLNQPQLIKEAIKELLINEPWQKEEILALIQSL